MPATIALKRTQAQSPRPATLNPYRDAEVSQLYDSTGCRIGEVRSHYDGYQEIYGRRHHRKGAIKTDDLGIQVAYDNKDRLLGSYDPRTNVTTDDRGQQFCRGNDLLVLMGAMW